MKDTSSTRFWQMAGVIVAVISIVFNIYQFIHRQAEKEIAAGRILRLTEQLYQAQVRESMARERMAQYDVEIHEIEEEKQQHRIRAEGFRREAERNAAMVEYYKKQIDEIPDFPDLSDDEHLQFFLEWTSPGGSSPRP